MTVSGAATAAGLALVAGGVTATVWGMATAAGRRRPLDLLGALAAPLGLFLALVGGVALLVPGFLGW